ncbi:SCP2 sterol-binding domain-containing protein [Alteromonas sp. C1M14]|uniref:ubiquinone biosynthesis accessory factor UbiJ n=1 Tax=Alteromonas sp. C1M14 TaxID=2841567 RepID=UPI001C0A46B8|nr:SCP2 sterol-binding domain-containing protein [Alteromonas sp. C1M14]MBU2977271.1 SCP2 sterol-binding domain-containing protein [Alteromonas sp. C1M14]
MPATALLTALSETVINRLVALDADSAQRLRPLANKRLYVFIANTPLAFSLVFSDRIDMVAEHQDYDEIVKHLDSQSCCVQVALDTLPQLQQSSRLTALIQEGKLSVEGELAIAQQVSQLFQGLDIDFEELLSRYTGDIAANQLFSTAGAIKRGLDSFADNFKAGLSNALTEEKNIGVPSLAVAHFADEVSDLRDDTERFAARLAHLEASLSLPQETD